MGSYGEVVVTGATGGVGCFAVTIFAREGFTVVASTGKAEANNFLTQLGASQIVSRTEIDD